MPHSSPRSHLNARREVDKNRRQQKEEPSEGVMRGRGRTKTRTPRKVSELTEKFGPLILSS